MSSTALGHAEGQQPTPSAAPTASDEPWRDDPGRLVVADQVVEKIAGHAVTLVPGAAAAPRRVLGMNVGGARPDHAASVSAEVQDGIAKVQATIAVRWPMSVQVVADEVRRRIRDDVGSLTGVRVDHVDVEVVSMTVPGPTAARVR
jgi:uncharacterized alkaline shock family protein YloU